MALPAICNMVPAWQDVLNDVSLAWAHITPERELCLRQKNGPMNRPDWHLIDQLFMAPSLEMRRRPAAVWSPSLSGLQPWPPQGGTSLGLI